LFLKIYFGWVLFLYEVTLSSTLLSSVGSMVDGPELNACIPLPKNFGDETCWGN
jgi:hypothetical protein